MRSKRNFIWILTTALLVFIGVLVGGCQFEKIISCTEKQDNTSTCDETQVTFPDETTRADDTMTPVTANTDEVDFSSEVTEISENCSCEDVRSTVAALQGTLNAMDAVLHSSTPRSPQASATSPITETPSPTTTETPTESITSTPTNTFTPPPTFTPSSTPTITPSPTRSPNALFWDEFVDNSREWELPEGAEIEGGNLKITGVNDLKLVTIPVEISNEFYVEVDAKLYDDKAMNTNIVFAFGNFQPQQPYIYINFNKDFADVFQIVDGRSQFVSSIQMPIESFGTWQRIGVSYYSGQLEIYLDGNLAMITQVSISDLQIALGGQFGELAEDNAVYFDYLEVFSSRKQIS